ncbi:MAG: NADP-dependent phosphogluconate dehydrogenase [Chloroflexota bacterium]
MKTRFFILMGVSGSGKTAVGKALAKHLGWDFFDADDFHPPANVAKMASGIPLDDSDRAPWLGSLHELISSRLKANRPAVLACSALKERYRQQLLDSHADMQLVYLKGSYDLIWSRMEARAGHYMKPSMLKSQFDALEEPVNALTVDIALSVDEIVGQIANLSKGVSMTYQIGILGLGVMGRSLSLNFHRHGQRVAGYDPAPKVPKDFPITVAASVEELVPALTPPRILLLMVPAGKPVTVAIDSLKPLLQSGDVIIDGGNSFFADTERRVKSLEADGISFVGMGVSGGESGALLGPSLMPGGAESAWGRVRPVLESIAAKTSDGAACVAWMGRGGAGHYVKMVHNGIEYADMQLIAETYDLLHRGLRIPNNELADIFDEWNRGALRSYLIEITADILRHKEGEADLLDKILDEASQKGTGKWTSQNALDLGVPIPTINAAVEVRTLSSLKTEREKSARLFGGIGKFTGSKKNAVNAAHDTLFTSKITSYAQGFALLKQASAEYQFDLDFAEVARIWRAGCIIRADLLEHIRAAFERDPRLPNLLMDNFFRDALLARQSAWRKTVQTAVALGIPMLATSSSLAYFDAYRSERLPANLIQAQRDYFGAHTYRRVDRDGTFHTKWK